MINHLRTLLLNRSGSNQGGPGYFMEEYVDPSFGPIYVDPELLDVRDVLFPRNCDRAYANYRLRQYTTIIHSTEFEAYAYVLDPRVTYLHTGQRPLLEDQLGVKEGNTEAADAKLALTGQVSFVEPRVINSWKIEVLSPTLVSVLDTLSGRETQTTVIVTDSLSSPFKFPGQLTLSGTLTGTLTTGAVWYVSGVTVPRDDISDTLLKLQELPTGTLTRLFLNAEPYKTFEKLFRDHALLNYQLSGVLLAYVFQLEETRKNGR